MAFFQSFQWWELEFYIPKAILKRLFSIAMFRHEKHLVIGWLTWWQNKRYLINVTFYETFKDQAIPHQKFTFLRQGSYEIPGGWTDPIGIRCSIKTPGIQKVKLTLSLGKDREASTLYKIVRRHSLPSQQYSYPWKIPFKLIEKFQ